MKTILILGGYGNFGKRIAQHLCGHPNLALLIAGRNPDKAERLMQQLTPLATTVLKPVAVDINADTFEQTLIQLNPDIVIHTSGPFQGQDHRVPQACLQARSHYIDLADDRRFVCDIARLDHPAKQNNVALISGASSVPGLSSTVIAHYANQFARLDSIDIAIAPGNKAERGEATIRGILSYTGHPFTVFKNGNWQSAYGWMDIGKADFGSTIGKRWLANVDVPDLELFPDYFSVKQRVSFQAGLELGLLHLTMTAMAWLAKTGLVKNWAPLTKPIMSTSNLFKTFGTDIGGMIITLRGQNHTGTNKEIRWTLTAEHGIGPFIPTLSTIIIAEKLLQDPPLPNTIPVGAHPCLNLYNLSDFQSHADRLGLTIQEQITG